MLTRGTRLHLREQDMIERGLCRGHNLYQRERGRQTHFRRLKPFSKVCFSSFALSHSLVGWLQTSHKLVEVSLCGEKILGIGQETIWAAHTIIASFRRMNNL